MARPSDQNGIRRIEDPLGPRRGPASPRPEDQDPRGFGWVWSLGLLVVILVLAGPAYVVATRGRDVIGECRDQAARVDEGFRHQAQEFVGCAFTR